LLVLATILTVIGAVASTYCYAIIHQLSTPLGQLALALKPELQETLYNALTGLMGGIAVLIIGVYLFIATIAEKKG